METNSKKIAIVSVAGLLATVLFYKQGIGINTLLFAVFCLVTILINRKIKKLELTSVIFMIINGISLCISFQWLSFLLMIVSIFFMVALHHPLIGNSFFRFCQGFLDSIMAGVDFILSLKNNPDKKSKKNYYWLGILISMPIVLIFFSLYSIGNPVFSYYLSKIDLSFIDFGSIVFFLVASYFSVAILLGSDQNIKKRFLAQNIILPRSETTEDPAKISVFKILFISLSVILALFHLSDLSLIIIGTLPENMTMTQYLHQGFWTLVTSIILSVVLVLAFFNGQMGYHENASKFRTIVSTWLALNTILLISTAIKNSIYVLEYGLTYKRIAVYSFLGIALITIIFCLVKVFRNQYIEHFIGKTMMASLLYLSLIGFVPWSAVITKFNLSDIPKRIDVNYLISLSGNKAELYEAKNNPKINLEQKTEIETLADLKAKEAKNTSWQEWNWQIQKQKELPEIQKDIIIK
jgi:hypothetical protein